MNNELLTQIGVVVITVMGAIITYIVIPYIKSRTTTAQQNQIKAWVEIAVQAAEQLMNTPRMGENKKLFVLNFLQDKGITLSENQLNVLIEAAVYQINNVKATS